VARFVQGVYRGGGHVMNPGASDRRTVLIADDDELMRWSAAEGLRESGYSVEAVANAREALLRCPDAAAILLDQDLPDVDGLALADTLRLRHPRCAVLLMTADLTPELRRRARERGIVAVLRKPFSLETLAGAICQALEHSPTPAARRQREDDDGASGDGTLSRGLESGS
jgi:CheY-like chemotaxis protein